MVSVLFKVHCGHKSSSRRKTSVSLLLNEFKPEKDTFGSQCWRCRGFIAFIYFFYLIRFCFSHIQLNYGIDKTLNNRFIGPMFFHIGWSHGAFTQVTRGRTIYHLIAHHFCFSLLLWSFILEEKSNLLYAFSFSFHSSGLLPPSKSQ